MPHKWKWEGQGRTSQEHYKYKCLLCGSVIYKIHEPPDGEELVSGYRGDTRLTCEEKQAESVHQS